MTLPKHTAETDSDKIKLIPEVMEWVAQLYRVIITGDITKGEPGLLEDIRNIRRDLQDIKVRQVNYEELERRVKEIETRHAAVDAQKKQRDEVLNKYNLTLFGIVATQIVMLVMEWLKR